jgi:hypothetical protein
MKQMIELYYNTIEGCKSGQIQGPGLGAIPQIFWSASPQQRSIHDPLSAVQSWGDMRCYTVNCSKHHVENITFSCLWHILHPITAWGHDHPSQHSTITHLALQLKNQSVSDRRLEARLITDNTKSKNQEIHFILLHLRGVDAFKFKKLNTNDIL